VAGNKAVEENDELRQARDQIEKEQVSVVVGTRKLVKRQNPHSFQMSCACPCMLLSVAFRI
jgi:hypothetical protein